MGWAPPGFQTFSSRIILPRFKARNRTNLPRGRDGNFNPVAELPYKLGGLNLCPYWWKYWDPGKALQNATPIHRKAIWMALEEKDPALIACLSRFSGNRYARGINTESRDKRNELILKYLSELPAEPLEALRPSLEAEGFVQSHQGYRHLKTAAAKAGYLSKSQMAQTLADLETQRSLFREVPSGVMKPATWEERYKRMDEDLLKEFPQLAQKPEPDSEMLKQKLLDHSNADKANVSLMEQDLYIKKSNLVFYDSEKEEYVNIPHQMMVDQIGLNLPQILKFGRESSTSLSSSTAELQRGILHSSQL